MRILPALMQNRRPMPKGPVPFQEILPLKLKPGVSGKMGKTSDVCCVHEMSVMFACFKANEFQQQPCSREIDAFQKCYMKNLDDKSQRADRDLKGLLSPGEKNLTPKQINLLLSKYPNHS